MKPDRARGGLSFADPHAHREDANAPARGLCRKAARPRRRSHTARDRRRCRTVALRDGPAERRTETPGSATLSHDPQPSHRKNRRPAGTGDAVARSPHAHRWERGKSAAPARPSHGAADSAASGGGINFPESHTDRKQRRMPYTASGASAAPPCGFRKTSPHASLRSADSASLRGLTSYHGTGTNLKYEDNIYPDKRI